MCRNVLIYFNLKSQTAILSQFHSALNPTGFLFLGKTEAIINQGKLFTPINLEQRIFSKGQEFDMADYWATNLAPS